VHIKGSLSKDESSCIRYSRANNSRTSKVRSIVVVESVSWSSRVCVPPVLTGYINSTSIIEKTVGVDEGTSSLSNSISTSERVNGVRKSIDGISVVEWLGTKGLVKSLAAFKRSTVVNILIRLDNPDKFLDRVVEVKLDLVRRRSNRFITSELKLLNQILVRVLGHSASLIGVKEDIVDIKRSSNKRLVVSSGDLGRSRSTVSRVKGLDSP